MTKLLSKVGINCDMGEGFGKWKMGLDADLIGFIDYANIACGFHAGDPTIMLSTIRLAKAHGVKCGAHPGLPDLFGFGRRQMVIAPHDMYCSILYQVGALKAMLDAEGVPLNHIKPHGDLFMYMERDMDICEAVIKACATFKVPVFGTQGCANKQAMCKKYGLELVIEAYVDTQYDSNGVLQSVAASRMATVEDIYNRAISIGMRDEVESREGPVVPLGLGNQPFMFCIHSDMPTAIDNIKACRRAVDQINKSKGL